MAAVNRLSALRVSSVFQTVSDDALCIISGLMPIEKLAVERKQLYEHRSSIQRGTKDDHEAASNDGKRIGTHLRRGGGYTAASLRLMNRFTVNTGKSTIT